MRDGESWTQTSDEDMREGPSGGENGGGKSAVIGEEGIPQKRVEEVGDGHLPRKKEGPDETGKDVESQRGTFSRTGAVEVGRSDTENRTFLFWGAVQRPTNSLLVVSSTIAVPRSQAIRSDGSQVVKLMTSIQTIA